MMSAVRETLSFYLARKAGLMVQKEQKKISMMSFYLSRLMGRCFKCFASITYTITSGSCFLYLLNVEV